jgi:hypothetical protein
VAGLTKKERERRKAEWRANEDRVRKLGDLFSALPACPEKEALWAAMADRIIDLFNESKFEEGDAVLEFLPNDYARQLLDWYFDDDENSPQTAPSPPSQHEAAQPGQVQSEPQEPGRSDRERSIIEAASDIVALWQSPNIQVLPRAERNAAIEETRNRLIEAVTATTLGAR